jgi:hypothetical protein
MANAFAVRERLHGDGLRVPAHANVMVRAAGWAWDYHLTISGETGRRRVHLDPRDNSDGEVYPPAPKDVPDDVAQAWSTLAGLVVTDVAKARLRHALFERGGAGTREQAQAAVDAYLVSASTWARGHDRVEALGAGLRLARAVGDTDRADRAVHALLEQARQLVAEGDQVGGVALKTLDYLIDEAHCPGDVDDLLETQATALTSARMRDRALELMLRRATKDENRATVWGRRVDAALAEAAAADSNIMRSMRLREAVQLAEQSELPSLRDRAVSALQAVRDDVLEMMHISAGSRLFVEQFELMRDSLVAGDNWQQALVTLAGADPLTGDAGTNERAVREQMSQHPLATLFPTVMYGPDGMPYYEAKSREDVFDVELVHHEEHYLRLCVEPVLDGLMTFPSRFGIPRMIELFGFLRQWPGMNDTVASCVADGLVRLWCGDGLGAVYTLLPQAEAQVLALVLASKRGIHRSQRAHTPAQFPALGALLPILADEYQLDASRRRHLSHLLVHPVGMNMRNLVLHGVRVPHGPGEAALLIQAMLFLGTLEHNGPEGADEADEADGDSSQAEPGV